MLAGGEGQQKFNSAKIGETKMQTLRSKVVIRKVSSVPTL